MHCSGSGDLYLRRVRPGGFRLYRLFIDKRVKRAALGSSEDELLRTSDPTVRVGARITVDGVTYDTTDPDTVMPEGIVMGSILGSAPSGKGTTMIIDRTRLEPFRYRRK